MPNTRRYEEAIRYEHFSTTGTGIERGGVAKLIRVTVNDPNAAASLELFESPTTAGEKIAVIDCATAGTYEFGVTLTGLTATLGGGDADVTVIYQ